METILLPHLESYPIHAGVFTDVRNASFLQDQLRQGNAQFEYAFLDGAMVLNREHVLAACFRAVNDMAMSRLRTRNVHSEIVFALSPNNNIAESFKHFGVSPNTTTVLALKVATSPSITLESVQAHLTANIDGKPVALDDEALRGKWDLARLKKVYKLDLPPYWELGAQNLRYWSSAVLGIMALKGY